MDLPGLFDLSGKVALVTGGYGHLGFPMSEIVAQCGAEVYIGGRNEQVCEVAAHRINISRNGHAHPLYIDVSSSTSVNEAFGKITSRSNRLDILVNNAVFGFVSKNLGMDDNEWNEGIDGTINSVFRCIRAAIPVMISQREGVIINIASMYGIVSPDPRIYGETKFLSPPNYGAGKAAVLQLTRYYACQLAPFGIRVNAISPGPFPRTEVSSDEWFLEQLISKVPLRRIGMPDELKGPVLFLASKASSFVTGANLVVDGGWTAW